MSVIPGITALQMQSGATPWYLIENTDHFLKRFEKARKRGKFLDVRYAGTNYAINPKGVLYFKGYLDR